MDATYVIAKTPGSSIPVAGSSQRFPVHRVYCIGRNYPWPNSHSTAAGTREPLVFFMKPADAVVPIEDAIAYPCRTSDFCHEIELVVALKTGGKNIPLAQALDHVWGYAVGLDMTRRDLQGKAKAAGLPWEGAKAFDASAPCSPLVPASSVGHPAAGAIWLHVNGQERQRGDLSQLMWPVAEIIQSLSQSVELKAGDVIFTGTPAGVAALQPGDVLEGGIAGVGQFSTHVLTA